MNQEPVPASSTFASVASTRPSLMFSRTVVSDRGLAAVTVQMSPQ
jgi:hypothetical protein